MSELPVGRALRRAVRTRAGDQCEYCRLPRAATPVPFRVDHVVARKHGGRTTAANLAYCCSSCNLHKGSDPTSFDPTTKRLVRLFNPRSDSWSRHFAWRGDRLVGRTATGRATVVALSINRPDNRSVLAPWLRLGPM